MRADTGIAVTLAAAASGARPVLNGSAVLVDADQVARGIAERAVADAVRLLGRLLDDLGVAGLQPLEGAVQVVGGQGDDRVGSLGHHLADGAALLVGDTRSEERRVGKECRYGWSPSH